MWTRNVRFDLVVGGGCCLLLAFFAWHAWFGTRSFEHMRGLSAKLAALRTESQALEAEKLAIQKHVALMRPESVDPDLLEELARVNLGWVGSNEIIVKTAAQAD